MLRARRPRLAAFVLAALASAVTAGEASAQQVAAQPKPSDAVLTVYIGTYTGPKEGKGIYRSTLDLATGKLTPPEVAAETRNPSFLAIHPTRKFLYAVGEIDDFGGKKGAGAVSGFAIDPATGSLTALNQQSSGGGGPCFVQVDGEGKNALVANYGGGSIAVLPIGADGRLAEATSFVQHAGTGGDPARQKGPHAHSINVDAANKFVFAADLGLDKVLVYKFDAATGKIAPNDPPAGITPPASGPRHFAFHPGNKFAYVINELSSTVTAFAYDAARGALTEIETISSLPDGKAVKGNSTADLHVHPSGKFLYGSNRGHDSIAAFAIDPSTGKLTPIGHTPTGGKTPRNFGIDPSGQYLLAANQNSGTIAVFKIDAATGALTPTGTTLEVPSPVCVKFVALGK